MDARQFGPILKVALKKENRSHQVAYESGRLAGFLSARPHYKSGSGIDSPEKLMKFSWEKKEILTEDQISELKTITKEDIMEIYGKKTEH